MAIIFIQNLILTLYKETSDGKWMNNLDFSKLKFYWCKSMTDENEVLGCWTIQFTHFKKILKIFQHTKYTFL